MFYYIYYCRTDSILLKKEKKSLNDMQGNVNLPGQAIIESLLHLSFQR